MVVVIVAEDALRVVRVELSARDETERREGEGGGCSGGGGGGGGGAGGAVAGDGQVGAVTVDDNDDDGTASREMAGAEYLRIVNGTPFENKIKKDNYDLF